MAYGAQPSASDEKLRQLMERARSPDASNSGDSAVPAARGTVTASRMAERAALLKTGETALARLDVTVALDAFDRAALILHAADTEIALVRTYMQGGEYRRALAFGAHTAGAHLDVIGGSALYAWLLQAGGQGVIAQRLLMEAEARKPGDQVLAAVRSEFKSGVPVASGQLLATPTRLAPYGQNSGVPAKACVLGSGLLLASGTQALVPAVLLPRSGGLWLRNGLGQLSRGVVEKRLPDLELAVINLKSPLPAPENLSALTSAAFPGSVAYAVEYARQPDAEAAWPVLRTGFLGAASGDSGTRKLGVYMPPGPRGGPVFDVGGRLMGVAISHKTGSSQADQLIPSSFIDDALRAAGRASDGSSPVSSLGPAPLPGATPRASVDQVYEIGLKSSLQLIGLKGCPQPSRR